MLESGESPLPDALAGETGQGVENNNNDLVKRLNRYSVAHHRALDMSHYARQKSDVNLALKLGECGHYLLFRDYFTVGKVRLHSAKFCSKHLLCPLCAIRRGAKQVKAYLDRLQIIRQHNPGLQLSLVTFTVKNAEDLGERFRHLTNSFRKMQHARRNYLNGRGPHVELAKVEGAVGSYEFKRGQNSGLWHPHVHMVVLHREDICRQKMSDEWQRLTGDSFMIDVTPFHEEQDPVDGFLEVFKYALKFSEMSLDDNWQGFKTLSGKRLVFSFGLFWGVDVPEDLSDEGLDELPYVDMLFRFMKGSGYSRHSNTSTTDRLKPFTPGEVVKLDDDVSTSRRPSIKS